ncbi:hypothetical protein JCM19992_16580 [Thermostilla marina]
MPTRMPTLILLAILATALGCRDASKGVAVRGTVTLDNQPLAAGYVTFSPLDGNGAQVGAPIKDGAYRVENVPPGDKVVLVTVDASPQFPKTSDEMMQMNARQMQADALAKQVADAEGNRQKITIGSELSQTLDIQLTSR